MNNLKKMKQTMKMNDSSMSNLSKIEQKNIIAGTSGNAVNTVSAECQAPISQGGSCRTFIGAVRYVVGWMLS